MITEIRKDEILSQITAFSKTSFTKAEFLPEMLKLQQEMVHITFSDKHADNANLRLWDVEKHFRNLNEERNNIADFELDEFSKGCKSISNAISAEFSGNAGEHKVFRELEKLECENIILKNIEIEYEGRRTEIDTIVFTRNAIFIIEIKNSKKNIFIDENGDFYRTGYSMHYDCNIADKMDEREYLLRKALESSGITRLKIFKIVAFTNPQIDVENKYHYIKVCGCNYLPVFIDNFTSNCDYSYGDMSTMAQAVNDFKCPEAYQMSINMDEFKSNFAELVAKLESAEDTDTEETSDTKKVFTDNTDEIKSIKVSSFFKGAIVSAAAITFINLAVAEIKKLNMK